MSHLSRSNKLHQVNRLIKKCFVYFFQVQMKDISFVSKSFCLDELLFDLKYSSSQHPDYFSKMKFRCIPNPHDMLQNLVALSNSRRAERSGESSSQCIFKLLVHYLSAFQYLLMVNVCRIFDACPDILSESCQQQLWAILIPRRADKQLIFTIVTMFIQKRRPLREKLLRQITQITVYVLLNTICQLMRVIVVVLLPDSWIELIG
mmetsp:Transcript_5054/g.7707  ORF Transcript_5054/g.7707 Transcript_5054/m.7707 type:complete len:205 (-) Transcript_5054:292-906(-)